MHTHIAQWSAAFCSNIRYLRKTHGLTQAQMADIMGVGISTVRLLENGTLPKRLSYVVLFPLCEYFDLSYDALFVPMD